MHFTDQTKCGEAARSCRHVPLLAGGDVPAGGGQAASFASPLLAYGLLCGGRCRPNRAADFMSGRCRRSSCPRESPAPPSAAVHPVGDLGGYYEPLAVGHRLKSRPEVIFALTLLRADSRSAIGQADGPTTWMVPASSPRSQAPPVVPDRGGPPIESCHHTNSTSCRPVIVSCDPHVHVWVQRSCLSLGEGSLEAAERMMPRRAMLLDLKCQANGVARARCWCGSSAVDGMRARAARP